MFGRARAKDGSVALMTALMGVAIVGGASLAIDVGSVYLESRRLQGTADLAAIAAMQNPSSARTIAEATVRANHWPAGTRVSLDRGDYTADRAIAPGDRFRPKAGSSNAVRVQLTSSAPLYFGRIFVPSGRMTISRRATATQRRVASFQIGTRLLSLQGGVANQILSALTGSTVSLSVMDYNALARADVDLLAFSDALRTRLDMEAASFDETLAHETELPDALQALADALTPSSAAAASAVRDLAAAAAHRRLRLDEVIDLGPYGALDHRSSSGATAIQVSGLDLANAILQIANGNRQIQLDLGAGVPGLASTRAWLAIGERPNNSPWLAVTDDENIIISTAQTRLYVVAEVNAAGAVRVRIPVLTELAAARAKLASINCSLSSRRSEVTLAVSPSIGSLTLGEINTNQLNNFTWPLSPTAAQLARVGPLTVEGQARVALGGEQWTNVRFSNEDIDRGTVKSVATRDAAQATISSLLGRTQLNVRGLGLSLGAGALTSLVSGALTAAARPLDDVVNGLSSFLGVGLGEADVRVNGVRCGGAALVA